jgi:hypothetical protein
LCNVWEDAGLLTAPILVLQGDADEIVNPNACLEWLPRVGARDRTFKMIPGHLHALLVEPSWESTTADILRWMNRRVPVSAAETTFEYVRNPPRFSRFGDDRPASNSVTGDPVRNRLAAAG